MQLLNVSTECICWNLSHHCCCIPTWSTWHGIAPQARIRNTRTETSEINMINWAAQDPEHLVATLALSLFFLSSESWNHSMPGCARESAGATSDDIPAAVLQILTRWLTWNVNLSMPCLKEHSTILQENPVWYIIMILESDTRLGVLLWLGYRHVLACINMNIGSLQESI